jgi:hypothetical protein
MTTHYYEKAVQEDIDFGTGTATVRNPGGGTLTGTQVGIHSLAVGQKEWTDTWDPGSIASGAEEAKEVTVTDAALGDYAIASFSLDVADLTLDANVTAANTVTCVLTNNTGAAVDLSSGTISVLVFKSR